MNANGFVRFMFGAGLAVCYISLIVAAVEFVYWYKRWRKRR